MKHITPLIIAGTFLCLQIKNTFSMDENTALVPHHDDHELVTVTLYDGITLDQAYKNGLRANTQGYLIYTDKNLISCAGLNLYKDKLHLATITHLDLKRNKLTEFHAEFLSAIPQPCTFGSFRESDQRRVQSHTKASKFKNGAAAQQ